MKRNSKSVLNGKGFYVALTLSIAMVGAACYFAYTQTSDDYTAQVESGFGVAQSSQEQEAAKIQTDVTKLTTRAESKLTKPTEITQTSRTEATQTMEEITEQSNEAEQTVKQEEFTLSMPVEGEIIGEFSNGELVKSATTGAWQTHNGIDINASEGDVVIAAASGTVSAVENNALWGVTVSIDHGNGIITRYCSLNSGVTVQAGQEVSAGEEIGAVGKTADIESKQDTHLHFEVVKNGSYTNPADYM